jgi:hypothetical protein
MKTVLFLSLTIMMCLSCTKEPIDPANQGNVIVTLDFGFPASGNITAKSESSYLDFYTKYISSKVLTPKTYFLYFQGVNLHNYIQVSGKWGIPLLVALPPDRYEVGGFSWPTKYSACGDTCYLKFNETVDITQTSTNITLKAIYDCSLILLDTTDVKSTKLIADTIKLPQYRNTVKTTMMKSEDFYHTFLSNNATNGVGQDKIEGLSLKVTSRQKELITHPEEIPFYRNKWVDIPLSLYIWEAGKYYYFSNTSNGYNLSPMTN